MVKTLFAGLFRLFVPFWLRAILRMPWWGYGLFLALWLAVAFSMVTTALKTREAVSAAREAAAPVALSLDQLAANPPKDRLDALAVQGYLPAEDAILVKETKTSERLMVVLEDADGSGPVALFRYEHGQSLTLKRSLDAALAADGSIVLYGQYNPLAQGVVLTSTEAVKFGLAGRDIMVFDHAATSHAESLELIASDSTFDIGFALTIACILALATGTRFVLQRKKKPVLVQAKTSRVAKQPPKAKATGSGQPARVQPAKAAPKVDQFKDSPIVTKNGWFS